MKSKSKLPDEAKMALLPPCVICSSKATGLHFGVNTCEACKAFFRRCLTRRKEKPLVCPRSGNCNIHIKINKTLCSACRYEKCLENGMSQSAIKTGRYSLQRKADLIRNAFVNSGKTSDDEVTNSNASSEHSDKVALGISATNVEPDLSSSFKLSESVQHCDEASSVNDSLTHQKTPEVVSGHLMSSSIPSDYNIVASIELLTDFSELNCPNDTSYSYSSSPHEPSLNINQNASTDRTKSKPTLVDMSVTTTQDLDHVIRQVAAAYEKYCPYTKDMKEKILENQARYKAEQEFFSDLFGPMKQLELEEYMEIYMNTGIDVDGRRELATNFVGHIDHLFQRLISFIKCIPGFTDINIDDQISLIRGGSMDWFLCISASAANVEHKLITSFFGVTFATDELRKIHGHGIPETNFIIFKMLQDLALDDTALALLTALCIVDPDQLVFHITNKEEVISVQYRLIEALNLYLSRTCERHFLIFNRAIAIMDELHRQRIRHHQKRVKGHGVRSKLGVMATPLLDAFILQNDADNEKQIPLVIAVMSNDEQSQETSQEFTTNYHMQL